MNDSTVAPLTMIRLWPNLSTTAQRNLAMILVLISIDALRLGGVAQVFQVFLREPICTSQAERGICRMTLKRFFLAVMCFRG
jgi:hypothetical protein